MRHQFESTISKEDVGVFKKKVPLDFKWHPYGQIIIIPKPKEILGTLPLLFTFDTPFRGNSQPTGGELKLVQETALEGTCTWQNQNPLVNQRTPPAPPK